jgi:hypothetical protein
VVRVSSIDELLFQGSNCATILDGFRRPP